MGLSAEHPSHVALVAFPFGTHAAPLLALARAFAAAAPATAVSFLSTARSHASLRGGGAIPAGNLRFTPLSDGIPGEASAAGIEEQIGMFLVAAPAVVRKGMEAPRRSVELCGERCVPVDGRGSGGGDWGAAGPAVDGRVRGFLVKLPMDRIQTRDPWIFIKRVQMCI